MFELYHLYREILHCIFHDRFYVLCCNRHSAAIAVRSSHSHNMMRDTRIRRSHKGEWRRTGWTRRYCWKKQMQRCCCDDAAVVVVVMRRRYDWSYSRVLRPLQCKRICWKESQPGTAEGSGDIIRICLEITQCCFSSTRQCHTMTAPSFDQQTRNGRNRILKVFDCKLELKESQNSTFEHRRNANARSFQFELLFQCTVFQEATDGISQVRWRQTPSKNTLLHSCAL